MGRMGRGGRGHGSKAVESRAGRPVRLPMYQLLHQLGVLPRLLGMGTGSQLLPKQHSKMGLPSSSMHLFGKDFSEATSVKRPLFQNWDLELKFTL